MHARGRIDAADQEESAMPEFALTHDEVAAIAEEAYTFCFPMLMG